MSKQSKYVEGMKNLQAAANNVNFWEEWISSTFHQLLKCSSNSSLILPEKVTIPELVHLILKHQSQHFIYNGSPDIHLCMNPLINDSVLSISTL